MSHLVQDCINEFTTRFHAGSIGRVKFHGAHHGQSVAVACVLWTRRAQYARRPINARVPSANVQVINRGGIDAVADLAKARRRRRAGQVTDNDGHPAIGRSGKDGSIGRWKSGQIQLNVVGTRWTGGDGRWGSAWSLIGRRWRRGRHGCWRCRRISFGPVLAASAAGQVRIQKDKPNAKFFTILGIGRSRMHHLGKETASFRATSLAMAWKKEPQRDQGCIHGERRHHV
jgi:hypothetical protein